MNSGPNASKENAAKLADYICKHKLPVLVSNISLDKRKEAGMVNGDRATTNVAESFNYQLQRACNTNRKSSFLYITEQIIKYITSFSVRVALSYKNIGDLKPISSLHQDYIQEYSEDLLAEPIRLKVLGYIDRKHNTTPIEPLFEYSVHSMCGITEVEGTNYEFQVWRILAKGSISISAHAEKPVACVCEIEDDEPVWYTVNASDKHWTHMWCTRRCKVRLS